MHVYDPNLVSGTWRMADLLREFYNDLEVRAPRIPAIPEIAYQENPEPLFQVVRCSLLRRMWRFMKKISGLICIFIVSLVATATATVLVGYYFCKHPFHRNDFISYTDFALEQREVLLYTEVETEFSCQDFCAKNERCLAGYYNSKIGLTSNCFLYDKFPYQLDLVPAKEGGSSTFVKTKAVKGEDLGDKRFIEISPEPVYYKRYTKYCRTISDVSEPLLVDSAEEAEEISKYLVWKYPYRVPRGGRKSPRIAFFVTNKDAAIDDKDVVSRERSGLVISTYTNEGLPYVADLFYFENGPIRKVKEHDGTFYLPCVSDPFNFLGKSRVTRGLFDSQDVHMQPIKKRFGMPESKDL